eukprot:UN26661
MTSSQYYIGVECFECNAYQVQKQKRVPKFRCKLCQTKQSIRKIFASSNNPKEVRDVVISLNLRFGKEEERKFRNLNKNVDLNGNINEKMKIGQTTGKENKKTFGQKQSEMNMEQQTYKQEKWSNYIKEKDRFYRENYLKQKNEII